MKIRLNYNLLGVAVITATLISCSQKQSNSEKLNEVKWQMYALNFQDTFIVEKLGKKVLPIECDLKLIAEDKKTSATDFYFYFYYQDTANRCYVPSGIDGITVYNDNQYRIIRSGMVALPYESAKDSIEITSNFMAKVKDADIAFVDYLRNNQDKSIAWPLEYMKKQKTAK